MRRFVDGSAHTTTVSRYSDGTRREGARPGLSKTGTKRVPRQANLTSRNRTQFHEIPAKPQVPDTTEATHNPKVAAGVGVLEVNQLRQGAATAGWPARAG